MYKFDVVVVGGGHAGVEAAYAVSRMGLSCALVTFSYKTCFLLFLLGFSPLYTINPFPNSNNKKYII